VDEIAITDPCVVFAMPRESRPFLREFRPHSKVTGAPCWARFCGPSWLSVLVLRSGIGPRRADTAMGWLSKPALFDNVAIQPKLVLSAGFAGALADELQVGDIVLATEVVDESGQRLATTWPGVLPAGPWQPPLHRGAIYTAAKPLGSPQEKRTQRQLRHAIAVDMETAVLAHWCQKREIPFGAVRAISDASATELSPRLLSLLGDDHPSPLRIAAAALSSPWLLRELWRLARDTRKAAHQLALALGELLTLTTPLGDV
jgi:nucleoside phosphorylase